MTDRVIVEGLVLCMTLGVEDWERRDRQDVLVDYAIESDLAPAGKTDRLDDSLNYRSVNKAVLALADGEKVHTVERLAHLIAETVLAFPGAKAVTVRVAKPGALRFAENVAVEIRREA